MVTFALNTWIAEARVSCSFRNPSLFSRYGQMKQSCTMGTIGDLSTGRGWKFPKVSREYSGNVSQTWIGIAAPIIWFAISGRQSFNEQGK